jgi:hypothetical protein
MVTNDSAKDYVKIRGIWENGGITQSDDIMDSDLDLIVYIYGKVQSISRYRCTKVVKEDLSFYLYIEPLSIKLSKTITERYGVNCRASFGDERCGINKSLYPKNTTCDKKFITCCNTFNNGVNFRGEPFISGSFSF